MSKKFILIFFLILSSGLVGIQAYAEESLGNLPIETPTLPRKEKPGIEAQQNKVEEMKARTSVQIENKQEMRLEELKVFRDQKLQEAAQKRTGMIAKMKDRSERLKAIGVEKQAKFEEIKLKQAERLQGREDLKEKFDELKIQRLELIKQHGALIDARYTVVAERLYKVLNTIETALQEKKGAGFDVSSAEERLGKIEMKVSAIELQQENMSQLLDKIEQLPADEIPSALNEIKNTAASTKQEYLKIKSEIFQLVRLIR